jgi:prevent-host-death family protein
MRTMTATEASRNFSDLLDAVERGESVAVTRGNRKIAEIRPAATRRGRDLRAALEGVPALDDRFEADIADAMRLLTPEAGDAWPGD